jgi:hypothetical protein
VRENRQPLSPDNVFWQAQERLGKAIESSLKAYGDMRDRFLETTFHAVYGSPFLQALAGLKASDASPRHRPGVDAVYRAFVAQRIDEITHALRRRPRGGDPRSLYVHMPGVADERGSAASICANTGSGLSLADFKTMVRDQFFTLLLDERRAIEAIRPYSTRTQTLPRAWQVPCAS